MGLEKSKMTQTTLSLDHFKTRLKTSSSSTGKIKRKSENFTLHLKRSTVVCSDDGTTRFVVFVDLESARSGVRFWALNEKTFTKVISVGLDTDNDENITNISNFVLRMSVKNDVPVQNSKGYKLYSIVIFMELQANYEEYFHNFANNLMQLLQHNQFIDMYEETYKSLGIENMKPYLDRLEEFRSSKTGFAALKDNLELKVTENVPLNTVLLNKDIFYFMHWFFDSNTHPTAWNSVMILSLIHISEPTRPY